MGGSSTVRRAREKHREGPTRRQTKRWLPLLSPSARGSWCTREVARDVVNRASGTPCISVHAYIHASMIKLRENSARLRVRIPGSGCNCIRSLALSGQQRKAKTQLFLEHKLIEKGDMSHRDVKERD